MDDDRVTAEPEAPEGAEDTQEAADAASDRTAGRTMTVAAVIISGFLFLGKFMGYAKEMLMSKYFGATGRTDAYKVAYNAVIYTIYTKVEKLMRPTYLPEFVRQRREHGEEGAWRVTGVVTTLQFLVLVLLALICVVFPEPILRLVGKGLSEEDLPLAVVMLRIMAPALVLFSLSVMPELTLHAYKRFTLPAVAEASFRTGLLLVFVALMALVWNPDEPTAIYAVAVGVLFGGVLRFVVQVPGLWSKLGLFKASVVLSTPGVRTILALMPPVVLGLIFATARTWADSAFGTDIAAGAYTCLDYARKIPDFALQVLPLAVSFVVYPFLSEWAMRGEKDKLADALVRTSRALAFVFIPTSVGLMVLSQPVIDLVYKHGQFGTQGAQWSSMALFCYAPGLFFFSLDASINHWYFALKDTRTPNYVGVACAILHVLIAYVGVYHLGGTANAFIGIATIALALTISKTTKIIILYGLIRKRIGRIDRAKVAAFALKLALATAAMGLLMHYAHQLTAPRLETLAPLAGSVKKQALANLGIGFIAGTVAFLVAAAALRVEELRMVLSQVTEKVRGRLGKRGGEG